MNLLLINACVRSGSRTRLLADAVINKICSEAPAAVTECDLQKENIRPLDAETLSKRDRLIAAGDYSDEMFKYARELAAADIIVVAAPFWDMSFPAGLKTYIEATMVTGLVFRYGPDGMPVSLCRAGKMIYVCTSGGSTKPVHYGYDYIRLISGYFWGVKDNRLIQAEMLDVDGIDAEAILRTRMDEIASTAFI